MSAGEPGLRIGPYVISEDLFRLGYPSAGGPCRCTSLCCEGGVHVDVSERDRILAHAPIIRRHMDATQRADSDAWFEGSETADGDFPSGRCVSTRLIRGKCAFLDGSGRCTLQIAATAERMDRWALKPTFCVLYPITIQDGAVRCDDLLQDEQACCSADARYDIPVFRACRDELVHLLGAEGYDHLERHFAAHADRSAA